MHVCSYNSFDAKEKRTYKKKKSSDCDMYVVVNGPGT